LRSSPSRWAITLASVPTGPPPAEPRPGLGQWRKDHEALDALLQAERLAPQEVHLQPAVQRLVVELLHRERRTTKPQLRELARRVGVLAA
jgi:hypothetical protein